jgi:hypothetical protein
MKVSALFFRGIEFKIMILYKIIVSHRLLTTAAILAFFTPLESAFYGYKASRSTLLKPLHTLLRSRHYC